MLNKAIVYWELKKTAQKDWKLVVSAIFIVVIKSSFPLRQQVPYAGSIVAIFLFVIAAISLTVLVRILDRRTSEIPFLKSRPLDASQLWPWRLLKTFLFVTWLSWSLAPLPLSQVAAHGNQVRVGGCEAIARFEQAGFAPRFSSAQDSEAYARFRAGEQTAEPCHRFATTTMPGLDGRLLLLFVLSALLASVAAVIADTFGNRRILEIVRMLTFWVVLIPVIAGMLQMMVNFSLIVFTDNDHLWMLYLYENTGIISVLMLLTTAVYLAIAHRAWRRMEVLG